MGSKSLLLLSLLSFSSFFSFPAFSQNSINVNATKSDLTTTAELTPVDITLTAFTLTENGSVDVIATLGTITDKDVIIDFDITGTANKEADYNTQFTNRGVPITLAGDPYAYTNRIYPRDIHVDKNGSVYVADQMNNCITRYDPGATTGIIVAGQKAYGYNPNQLDSPSGVFVDDMGNIYISDTRNSRIQKWAPGATSGITVAGGNGKGSAANQLSTPMGIHVDQAGNIYIADNGNHRVQRWSPNATTGTTVAGGNGSGVNSNQLWFPRDVFVDKAGNLLITDYSNQRIQKWTPGSTTGITIIDIRIPFGIQVDNAGNIYVSNDSNIKRWPGVKPVNSDYSGVIVAGTTYSGSSTNQLSLPTDFCVDKRGNLYIADNNNYRVQRYQYAPQIIVKAGEKTGKMTLAGITDNSQEPDKTIVITPVTVTNGLLTDYSSKTLILADDDEDPKVTLELSADLIKENTNAQVTLTAKLSAVSESDISVNLSVGGTAMETTDYTLSSKTILIPAGNSMGTITISTSGMDDKIVEPVESIIFTITTITNATIELGTKTLFIESDELPSVSLSSTATTFAEHQQLDIVATLDVSASKDVVIDLAVEGTAIFDLDYTVDFASKGSVLTIGTGIGNGASQFGFPNGIFVDKDHNLYITDYYYGRIQKWAAGAKEGSTVISSEQLGIPRDVFVDDVGNLYVSDELNNQVEKWAPGASQGIVVAGGNGLGSSANQLNRPHGIFIDKSGNVYVADKYNHRVQKWAPGANTGITVAGGNGEGMNTNQLFNPIGVLVDKDGAIYVSEQVSNRITKWLPGASSGILVVGNDFGSYDKLYYPMDLSFDKAGNMFVADQNNNRVQKFVPGSKEGITVAGGSMGSGPNQLHYPIDVCVDNSGNLYVSDQVNNRVQKYRYSPQIIIKAGETTGKVTLKAVQDNLENEGTETITIKALSVTNCNDSTRVLNITLNDNVNELTLKENPFPGLTNGATSWGDFDRDGDMDVAVMGQSSTSGTVTAVYENRNGYFVNTNHVFEKLYKGDIEWVDVNKDGWIDLVVSGYNNAPKTKLYLNLNGKSFNSTNDYGLPQLFDSKMAWGDLDNDGDMDLAITGIDANNQYLFNVYYRENNQDKFILDELMANKEVTWPGFIKGDLEMVDVDMDGDNDILYSGEREFKNQCGDIIYNSLFDTPKDNDFWLNLKNSSIAVARLGSNDNDLTIFENGEDFYGTIISHASKRISFISGELTSFEGPALKRGDIAVADYDNDGLNDIIYTGETNQGQALTKLYIQDKYGDFRESRHQLKGLWNSTADWIDYDMDGDLDLFLTGEDETGAKVLLYESNTTNRVNTPPSIVTGLKTEHLGNGIIRFSWDRPSDDVSSNLGYVLRLGTTPGGTQLSNTESNLQTGQRLISKPANTYNNFYETQLDPGTYYWSVQAIDPGLTGGKFSEENMFTLAYEWKILNQGGVVDRRIEGLKDPVVKLGDIDNDNDMDLIYGSAFNGKVKLLKYNGKGLTADNGNIFANIERLTDVEVGDLNGDGRTDILANNAAIDGSYSLILYMSTSNGFTMKNVGSGLYKAKGKIIDLNNDGKVEIVIIGLSNNLISGKLKMIIHEYNRYTGQFASIDLSTQITSLSNASFDLGDIDNDQDIDLIMNGHNGTTGYQCNIYENTTEAGGNYMFTNVNNNLAGVIDGTSDLIDIDGDGDLDVVITGTSKSGDVFDIYENQITAGNFSFVKFTHAALLPMRAGKVDLGDFNADGYNDLLYSGTVSGIGKMTGLSEYNHASKSFTSSAFDVSDIINAQVEFGDIEGDGDLDFAISGENSKVTGSYIFRTYINVRDKSAKAPSIPNMLEAKAVKTMSDGRILTEFSWNESSDDHTPDSGLTYALKIGKTSGGEEILSPNANLNGTRKTAQKGNVEHNLTWRLALPKDVYYWSVQAIDASYTGSSFPASQRINVSSTLSKEELDINKHLVTYPNPTSGHFKIIVPGKEKEVKVTIQNAGGSTLSESTMQVPSNSELNFNISTLTPGVYIIKVQSENLNHLAKIVKN